MDREKVIKGLHYCTKLYLGCKDCPYFGKSDSKASCEYKLKTDASNLLKEQITTSTNKSRIFHCEKYGYGIDDIFLSDEHNYQIEPHFCPNCGRSVK